ncbi:hypothetical protein JYU34_012709 [Plutella xylostella]|uniref:Uncharacterized protein n=1 Tax=Plutella xylostella TaxID=51655 RepID=A0ABQ7QCY1_PLUXY|nr:hypothetical protein JYU34_012709 [Plutella xylostella]
MSCCNGCCCPSLGVPCCGQVAGCAYPAPFCGPCCGRVCCGPCGRPFGTYSCRFRNCC